MEITRTSEAIWNGDLTSGEGTIKLGSKAFEGPYSFKGRTTAGSNQTNPEELIGAAHAGCFSMQLSALLGKAGFPPTSIHTTAKVHLVQEGGGFAINQIDLATQAVVPNISADEFKKYADEAKQICPVSKALAAVKINFTAELS